jgi:hypothetical protein
MVFLENKNNPDCFSVIVFNFRACQAVMRTAMILALKCI